MPAGGKGAHQVGREEIVREPHLDAADRIKPFRVRRIKGYADRCDVVLDLRKFPRTDDRDHRIGPIP